MGAGNGTQVLWKSSKLSWPLSHVPNLHFVFREKSLTRSRAWDPPVSASPELGSQATSVLRFYVVLGKQTQASCSHSMCFTSWGIYMLSVAFRVFLILFVSWALMMDLIRREGNVSSPEYLISSAPSELKVGFFHFTCLLLLGSLNHAIGK